MSNVTVIMSTLFKHTFNSMAPFSFFTEMFGQFQSKNSPLEYFELSDLASAHAMLTAIAVGVAGHLWRLGRRRHRGPDSAPLVTLRHSSLILNQTAIKDFHGKQSIPQVSSGDNCTVKAMKKNEYSPRQKYNEEEVEIGKENDRKNCSQTIICEKELKKDGNQDNLEVMSEDGCKGNEVDTTDIKPIDRYFEVPVESDIKDHLRKAVIDTFHLKKMGNNLQDDIRRLQEHLAHCLTGREEVCSKLARVEREWQGAASEAGRLRAVLLAQHDTIGKTIHSMKEQVRMKEDEISRCEKANKMIQEEIGIVKERLSRCLLSKQEFCLKMKHVGNEKRTAVTRVSELRAALRALEDAIKLIQLMKEQMRSKDDELSDCAQNNRSVREEIHQLKLKVSRCLASNEMICSKLKLSELEKETAEAMADELKEAVSAYDDALKMIDSLKVQMSRKDDEINQCVQSNRALQGDVRILQEQMAGCLTSNEEFRSKLTEAQSEKQKAEREVDSLRIALRAQEDALKLLKCLKVQLRRKDEEIDECVKNNRAVQEDIRVLRQQMSQCLAGNETFYARLKQTERDKQKAEAKVNELMQTLCAQEKALQKLRSAKEKQAGKSEVDESAHKEGEKPEEPEDEATITEAQRLEAEEEPQQQDTEQQQLQSVVAEDEKLVVLAGVSGGEECNIEPEVLDPVEDSRSSLYLPEGLSDDNITGSDDVLESFLAAYTFENRLGSGAFGEVYAATQTSDLKPVVIKIIGKRSDDKWVLCESLDPNPLPMEVAAMKSVSKPPHPGVIQLLDWCNGTEKIALVMERHSPCVNLEDYIQCQSTGVRESQARCFFQQIVQALQHCHACGVFHGDVTPDNILVNVFSEQVILIDFGIASFFKEEERDFFSGVLWLAPPEFYVTGRFREIPATVWSLGLILYEMVYKCLPFSTEHEIVEGHLKFERPISEDCEDIIRKCLAHLPTDRPTMEEIHQHSFMKGPSANISYEEKEPVEQK